MRGKSIIMDIKTVIMRGSAQANYYCCANRFSKRFNPLPRGAT